MAKNPEVDDSGALALRPQRVNIFARPATTTAERSARPRPGTIFDPAAACQPSGGEDRDHDADAPRLRLAGIARLFAIAGFALVVALVALQPSGTATIDRSRPPVHPHQARPNARSDKGARERTQDATRRPRPRPRKRTKPHRLPRPHRRQADARRRAVPPARIAPRPTPRPPAPRRPAPTRPLPAPVSPTSPPEFM